MTLTEFLLARIAEDERMARSAMGDTAGHWRSRLWKGCDQVVDADDPTDDCLVCVFPTLDMPRVHIARHDPARVLAECEAKRRIVEMVNGLANALAIIQSVPDEQQDLVALGMVGSAHATALACAGHAAAPYADHPDYPGPLKS